MYKDFIASVNQYGELSYAIQLDSQHLHQLSNSYLIALMKYDLSHYNLIEL